MQKKRERERESKHTFLSLFYAQQFTAIPHLYEKLLKYKTVKIEEIKQIS